MAATVTADVIIIGAGWSGLTAALRLSQAGRKVVVLEARERIGGRAFTHMWNDQTKLQDTARTIDNNGHSTTSYTCDLGCSWMHGYFEGSPLKQICERYNVTAQIPKPTKSLIVAENGPLSAELTEKLSANLSAAQAAAKDISQNQGTSRQHASTSLASFLFSQASPLYKDLSLQDKKFATALARTLHVPLGATLEQVGLRFNGFEHNYTGTDAAPEGGFTRLIHKVADEAVSLGTEIKTKQVVDRISLKPDRTGVVVSAKALDGGKRIEFQAKTAIVTIPLAVLKENLGVFQPSLPERRQAIIARTNVGNLNKVLLSYEKPWWSTEVGTFLVLPTLEKVTDPNNLEQLFASTTLIVSSLCAPNGFDQDQPFSLLVMIGADAAKSIETHQRINVGTVLHNYLAKRIATPHHHHQQEESQCKTPRHVFYTRWASQPFTKGATTTPILASDEEYNSPLDFIELARPLWDQRLGFAGEHTDLDHRGSVAGAVVSGEREAVRLLAFLDKFYPVD